MRTPLIAGNWKMNKTHLEGMVLVQQLGNELAEHDFERVEVAVCPPFTSLRTIQTLIDSDRYRFKLGAQNVYAEPEGAFTGEVAPPMLQALDVDYVIVGHSERREYFGETDEDVNAKVKALWAHDLCPIVCVGETEAEHDAGDTEMKVQRQVQAAFKGVKEGPARSTVVAYEPIWAIGTGKTATPEDAQKTIAFIRATLAGIYSEAVSDEIRILYGGSMKPGNAAALLGRQDIDGGLVGGASLAGGDFAAIVKAAAR